MLKQGLDSEKWGSAMGRDGGVPAEPVPQATGSGGCLSRPGGEAHRWARLSLSVPCTLHRSVSRSVSLGCHGAIKHMFSGFLASPVCVSLSLSTFLFPSLSDLFSF